MALASQPHLSFTLSNSQTDPKKALALLFDLPFFHKNFERDLDLNFCSLTFTTPSARGDLRKAIWIFT